MCPPIASGLVGAGLLPAGISAAQDVGEMYRAFRAADARHRQLLGRPSGEALYGQACCLSLAAETQLERRNGGPPCGAQLTANDVAELPSLPPNAHAASATSRGPSTLRALADLWLDLALEALSAVGVAGQNSGLAAQMMSDPSLQALREHRPVPFASLVVQGGGNTS